MKKINQLKIQNSKLLVFFIVVLFFVLSLPSTTFAQLSQSCIGKVTIGSAGLDVNGIINANYCSLGSTVVSPNLTVYGNSGLGITLGDYMGSPSIYGEEWQEGYVGTPNNPFWEMHASQFWGNGVLLTSDERKKKNIKNLDSGLETILKIQGKKYDFIIEGLDTMQNENKKQRLLEHSTNRVGFIAQELLGIIPDVVEYNKEADQYGIDYIAIIPYLVEAIKEQQTQIEELQAKVSNSNLKSTSLNNGNTPINQTAVLEQNIPNPFKVETSIAMVVPEDVLSATLYIYNMQGKQVKRISINERGNTQVLIPGYEFAPGMYLYSLITDGKEVGTKKMILTD